VIWWAAFAFYLLFLIGLIVFVIGPAVESGSLRKALLLGCLFGFMTYQTNEEQQVKQNGRPPDYLFPEEVSQVTKIKWFGDHPQPEQIQCKEYRDRNGVQLYELKDFWRHRFLLI